MKSSIISEIEPEEEKEEENISGDILDLINTRRLVELNCNKEQLEDYKKKRGHYFAFVECDTEPFADWTFEFKLIVRYNDIYYYYRFSMQVSDINILNNWITKNNFFPTKSYPKLSNKINRLEPLIKKKESLENEFGKQASLKSNIQQSLDDINLQLNTLDYQYKLEEKLFQIPKFPSHFRIGAPSLKKHGKNYTDYLQHLFSSPSLLKDRHFYTILKFPEPLRKYLANEAKKKLQTWTKEANKPHKLEKLQNLTSRYHICYACSRPVEKSKRIFNHWALKFEGVDKLLTIEYFASKEIIEYNRPRIQLLANTPSNRRIFWYWWDEQKIKNFNKRWKVIARFHCNIENEILYYMSEAWSIKYSQYNKWDNNCQHFVRDMVSCLNLDKAIQLNACLEHRAVSTIVSVIGYGDTLAEMSRTIEIGNYLLSTVHNVKKEKKNQDFEKNFKNALEDYEVLSIQSDDEDDDENE